MTDTLTPPPAPPTAAQGPGPRREPSAAGRVVAILALVFGAVLVVGAVLSATIGTISSALVRTETRTLPATAFSDLDVDLAAGELTVVFVDGLRAPELTVTSSGGAGEWTFAAEDDTLTVASPDHRWFPRWWFGGIGSATLRLPASAQTGGLDADLHAAAGELEVSGRFADLDVDLGAGRVTVSGGADELSLDVSAGSVELDLGEVRTADITVSAGAARTHFTGTAPRSITADVSAGSLDMTVPDGAYDIRSDVSAGRFDSRIASQPGAASTVSVQVSAGSATLTAR